MKTYLGRALGRGSAPGADGSPQHDGTEIGRHLDAVPFFWSMHYDISILYVGHAEKWDGVEIDGSVAEKDCRATYRRDGRSFAVATIGRDLESLRAELAFETSSQPPARQKS